VNQTQEIYALALACIGLVRFNVFAWKVLVISFLATLYVCYGMDIDAVTPRDAVSWYIVIDLVTCMALALHDRLAKVVACGFVITIPVYLLTSILDVQNSTTFAIVYPIAFIQLGVLFFGADNSGGRYIRLASSYWHGWTSSRLSGSSLFMGSSQGNSQRFFGMFQGK